MSLLIADKLREQFGHLEIDDRLVNKQTASIEAYEHYLKGRFHFNKWDPDEMKISILCYEKALICDPKHAPSMVGLADAYSFLGQIGLVPFEEGWGHAINYANQALAINDRLPEVHYILGNISFFTKSDFQQAMSDTSHALSLNPNFISALNFMSFLHILEGNKEESIKYFERAQKLDPLSMETLFFGAYADYINGNYHKCLDALELCLNANPGNLPVHSIKRNCLLKLEKYDEVLEYFDDLPQKWVILGEKTGSSALAYALLGDVKNTDLYLDKLQVAAQNPKDITEDSYLFLMYVTLGKNDAAFAWVEKAIENKNPLLIYWYSDPLAAPLRKDFRYDKYKKLIYGDSVIVAKESQKKQLLDDKTAIQFADKLSDHLSANKPFLDTNLSLRSLSDQIEIHPNQLSWLLNNIVGKSFSQYINHYRVEEFKKISKDPQNEHLTLVSLAYDSGFNSKTVFNTYFKRETGLTPKQFLKG